MRSLSSSDVVPYHPEAEQRKRCPSTKDPGVLLPSGQCQSVIHITAGFQLTFSSPPILLSRDSIPTNSPHPIISSSSPSATLSVPLGSLVPPVLARCIDRYCSHSPVRRCVLVKRSPHGTMVGGWVDTARRTRRKRKGIHGLAMGDRVGGWTSGVGQCWRGSKGCGMWRRSRWIGVRSGSKGHIMSSIRFQATVLRLFESTPVKRLTFCCPSLFALSNRNFRSLCSVLSFATRLQYRWRRSRRSQTYCQRTIIRGSKHQLTSQPSPSPP